MTAFSLNLDNNNIINLRDTFYNTLTSSLRFYEKMSDAFLEAYSVYMKTIFEDNNIAKDLPELEKAIRSRISNIFNLRFREDDFIASLSDIVTSYSALAKVTGLGKTYQHLSNLWSVLDNDFIEPLRDTLWRTPSYKITNLEKYSLFRYYDKSRDEKNNKLYPATPLLIVYPFINRHYILDLLPEVSVVRNLLNQGFDIYATDWGTPSAYDNCNAVQSNSIYKLLYSDNIW